MLKTAGDIGVLIRDRRREARLTQGALADRVGVSRQWLSDMERGKSTAEIGLVMNTLDALGVVLRVDELAFDHEIPTPADIDAIVREARKKRSDGA